MNQPNKPKEIEVNGTVINKLGWGEDTFEIECPTVEFLEVDLKDSDRTKAAEVFEAFSNGRIVIKECMGEDRAIVRIVPDIISGKKNGEHVRFSRFPTLAGFPYHTLFRKNGLWNLRLSTDEEINSF